MLEDSTGPRKSEKSQIQFSANKLCWSLTISQNLGVLTFNDKIEMLKLARCCEQINNENVKQ
jgi:hypothetical protein